MLMNEPNQTKNTVPQLGYPQVFRVGEFAAIALGGMLGALLRHAGELILPTINVNAFPWATFLENILGSFIIGFVVTVLARHSRSHLLSPFLVVGLIGSYTTFSTFAVGFWERMEAGVYLMAFSYALLTLVFGLVAVALGHLLGNYKKEET
jgi:CrcB protein